MLQKTLSKRLGRQPIDSEKMFSNHISDKDLVFGICKELLGLNDKRINNPILQEVKGLRRHFYEEGIQMAINRRRCSAVVVIREEPIKTT